MYYSIYIRCTSKPYFSTEEFTLFDSQEHRFATLTAAELFIQNRYGTCKRQKLHCEPDDEHVGWVFCFNEEGWGNEPGWVQNDWVEVMEVTTKPVLPNLISRRSA